LVGYEVNKNEHLPGLWLEQLGVWLCHLLKWGRLEMKRLWGINQKFSFGRAFG
jgi:hypothetical protein